MKPTPVNAIAFGFVTTKLKVLVPPAAMELGVNDFVIAGGRITVSVAHDWAPVPPFEDVGVTQLVPVKVPVTVNERVQPMTGNVTPESITDDVVTAGVTPQVFVTGVRLAS